MMKYLLTTIGVMYVLAALLYVPPFGRSIRDLARIIFWFATAFLGIIGTIWLTTRLLGDGAVATVVTVIMLVVLAQFIRIPFLRIASDIPTGGEPDEEQKLKEETQPEN